MDLSPESILPAEIPEKPSALKRTLIVIGGLILIILIVSFILVSFPIGNILQGKLASSTLQGNTIILRDFSIVFQNETISDLKSKYFQEQKTEFSLCLLGTKQGENYFITSFYQPKIYSQAFNEVIFEPCSADTLIMLHTHPYKSCIASQTDLETLNKTKARNPEVLMVVMCEPERFAVYG